MKEGAEQLYLWGRREWEQGQLPATGWARLESIKSGKWDRLNPTPVKVCVTQFAERASKNIEHWFKLTEGAYLQGALVKMGNEQRVYIVTVPSGTYKRWPRLIGQGEILQCSPPDDLFGGW